jgi:acetoin utilization deacetylase AcuC-like enzyme
MNRTGLVYDTRYLLHDTGDYHPETAERLVAIHEGLESGGLLEHLVPVPADYSVMKWIEMVHDVDYIQRFEGASLSGRRMLDYPDNQMGPETFEIAQLAVGGVIAAAREVITGNLDNAFCAVRPPGHHAEVDSAMGFCYFNNIAIAARYLQAEHGVGNVAIVDFDVHHGNGTQHIFEKDASVFYYSSHEHPSFAFPGTGRAFETGKGDGEGTTKNFPVLPGQGDAEYKEIVENDMLPALEAFGPEVLLISTGFDAHIDDDMSGVSLTTDGYSWIMQQLYDLADRQCGGKLISVLEGGYRLDRLGELARNHVNILLNR